jgi:hypothetical protein
MFAIVSQLESQPRVLKVGYHVQQLKEYTENYLINYIHDRVGKLNWVNTLQNTLPVNKIEFPLYPNFLLEQHEDKWTLSKVQKVTTVSSGWVRSYTSEEVQIEKQGCVYIVPIDIVDLKVPSTLPEVKETIQKSISTSVAYDEVLKELKEKLETKRKVHEQKVIQYFDDRNDIFVRM